MYIIVDLLELMTTMFVIVILFFLLGFGVKYITTPGPARNIWKGKWLKRGKRNFVNLLNDDNVSDVLVGRPTNWGIKVGKKRMLIPSSVSDLINKRAVLHGTGIPIYFASTRTGLATTPELVQLAEEVIGQKVDIVPKYPKAQKPAYCPVCANAQKESTKLKEIKKEVDAAKDKNMDTVIGWECETCGMRFEIVHLLNPHVMQGLAEIWYDPTKIEGIEQDAKEEARLEKPSWFIWLMIPAVLIFIGALIMVLTVAK